jgi:hypothetical protein
MVAVCFVGIGKEKIKCNPITYRISCTVLDWMRTNYQVCDDDSDIMSTIECHLSLLLTNMTFILIMLVFTRQLERCLNCLNEKIFIRRIKIEQTFTINKYIHNAMI